MGYLRFTQLLKEALGYDYGCAMLNFDFPELFKVQLEINPEDVYEADGKGLVDEPHVTLLYGFHEDVDAEDVRKIVIKTEYTECKIHKVSLFTNELFDVLKFTATADYLAGVNKRLCKLPHTTNFKDYQAHMTIAYLKKGTGKKYVRKFKGLEYKVVPKNVIFADYTNAKHIIPITVTGIGKYLNLNT